MNSSRLEDYGDVLTVEEAASILRIGRSAAYEAVRLKTIPSVKIGRRVIVPKQALARFLSGEPVPGWSPAPAAEPAPERNGHTRTASLTLAGTRR